MLECIALREAAAEGEASRLAGERRGGSATQRLRASPLQRIVRVVMAAGGGESAPSTRLLKQLLTTCALQN